MKEVRIKCNPYKKILTIWVDGGKKAEYINTSIYSIMNRLTQFINQNSNNNEISVKFTGTDRDYQTLKAEFQNVSHSKKINDLDHTICVITTSFHELIEKQEIKNDEILLSILKGYSDTFGNENNDDFSRCYESVEVLAKALKICEEDRQKLSKSIDTNGKRIKEIQGHIHNEVQNFFDDFIKSCEQKVPEGDREFEKIWKRTKHNPDNCVNELIRTIKEKLILDITKYREVALIEKFNELLDKMNLESSSVTALKIKNEISTKSKILIISTSDFEDYSFWGKIHSNTYTWKKWREIYTVKLHENLQDICAEEWMNKVAESIIELKNSEDEEYKSIISDYYISKIEYEKNSKKIQYLKAFNDRIIKLIE